MGSFVRGQRDHHAAVRECVRAYVRAHGHKRGLHLAAAAIGMGERAARHAHEGGEFASDGERAARADNAHLALLRDQIARLQAEASEIDSIRGRDGLGLDGPALDGAGILRGGARASVLSAR